VQSSTQQCSPLFLAAREDHPEIVRLLIGKGAAQEDGCNYREIDLHDGTSIVSIYAGATPLIVAIEEGNAETVAQLLRLGSDANQTLRKESYTLPRELDWQQVNALTTDELVARATEQYATDEWTPLLEAVERDQHDIVRLLLRAGADIGHRTADGTTALSLASSLGHSGIAELLR
jgi:ankyrin repeat protein